MNIVFNFSKRGVAAVGAVLALLLGGTACTSSGAADARVSVVASTNVWAAVASAVVGKLAGRTLAVKAIITDPAADPHSYEVSARDELAIKRADVIVENGGGYDDFVGRMRSAAGATGTVLDAVRVSGKRKVAGELNEHVWYDFPSVLKVATSLADVLSRKDPADRATFRANARAFGAKLRGLESRETAIKARYAGTGVAVTEALPLYLLEACGLIDRTPAAFSAAVEDEQDVSVRVIQQTEKLFTQHHVQLLVGNAQTTGPQTTQVIKSAKAAGVPLVLMTETLPAGADYPGWMSDNLSAVDAALAGGGVSGG